MVEYSARVEIPVEKSGDIGASLSPSTRSASRVLLLNWAKAPWRALKQHFTRLGAPGTIAYLACLGYIVYFAWLAFIKYYTFNDTFADLGIYNQQLWLLRQGGFSLLNSSHFNTEIYNFQFQEPIIFVVYCAYYFEPGIPTLLVFESAALGLAGIVLFHLARLRIGSGWVALLVTFAYLSYFPVASGNLVDFHLENTAPLWFLSMSLSWFSGRKKIALLFAALTAAVNPLMLLITCFFLVYVGMPERLSLTSLDTFLKQTVGALLRDTSRSAMIIGLLLLFTIYKATGTLATAGAGSGGLSYGFFGTVFFAINSKLLLFVLLFGSLAFLPLLDFGAMFVLLPFVGFVLYSTDSSNWIPFGLMYTEMAVGPLFLGLINGLRGFGWRPKSEEGSTHKGGSNEPISKSARNNHFGSRSPDRRPALALAVTVLVFAAVYFPPSPVNSYVQGGYFSGNHDYQGITTVTPADEFLWKTIALVPSDAAVLTQNSIPQLTGREYYQIAGDVHPNIPYNCILMDGVQTYFTDVSTLVPYAQAALTNKTFGIVAEGLGALLLEEGYSGPPELYDPTAANYTGNELALYSGSYSGTTIVGSGPAFSLWYGPSATLYPGSYNVTFAVSINTTAHNVSPIIALDVVSGGGSTVYSSLNLYTSNFSAPGGVKIFTLSFNITQIQSTIEYRGMFPSGFATITLHYIDVTQTKFVS